MRSRQPFLFSSSTKGKQYTNVNDDVTATGRKPDACAASWCEDERAVGEPTLIYLSKGLEQPWRHLVWLRRCSHNGPLWLTIETEQRELWDRNSAYWKYCNKHIAHLAITGWWKALAGNKQSCRWTGCDQNVVGNWVPYWKYNKFPLFVI